MLYTCPCIRVPHANHVYLYEGVPCCTWCLAPATPYFDPLPLDVDELDNLSGLQIGTAFLANCDDAA